MKIIGEREKKNKIAKEIDKVSSFFESSEVQIAYYNTEYRLPYVIAIYPDGTEKAWLTVTLPPYRSRINKSFVLRGQRKPGEKNACDKFDFFDHLNKNFDAIWEKYHTESKILRSFSLKLKIKYKQSELF